MTNYIQRPFCKKERFTMVETDWAIVIHNVKRKQRMTNYMQRPFCKKGCFTKVKADWAIAIYNVNGH